MPDNTKEVKRSITEEHIKAVDELIQLEEENLAEGLSTDQKTRWASLTQRLFGMGSYSERRQFFRVNAQRAAQIRGQEQEIDADVTSLSAGGLFLHTEQASQEMLGRDMDVVVRFPHLDEHQVQFKVQVCRVASPSQSDNPGLGVKFVDLDSNQRRFILDHLRHYLVDLLELSREKYHFFFEHSSDVAILVDPTGTILEVSTATELFLEIPGKELVGTFIGALIPTEVEKDFYAALDRTCLQEESRFPLNFKNRKGELLPVEAKLLPFHVRDLMIGAMLVAHDLREQHRLQQQQRAMERRLFQADKMATIGQITASIAHDINNPLAYVLTNLTLLEEYLPSILALGNNANEGGDTLPVSPGILRNMNDELNDLVTESLEGCRRIRDILLDIRSFSRMESKAEIRIDLNQALDASVRIVKNLIKHRARLERSFAADLPPTYLNFGRLTQVFLNLLTNAAHAFEHSDVENNVIKIRTWQQDGLLMTAISDNGRGIPEEIQELIFQPFFTTRRGEGGTGLGLVIARECIEGLGGKLELESEAGKGTCFTIALPVRDHSPTPQPAVRVTASSDKKDVLLIDDDEALLRSLERMLSRFFNITSTLSPLEGLKLIDQRAFDAVLCDVMMPEMSGIEFYDQVSVINKALSQKIIFMTGGTFNLVEEQRLSAIKNIVLVKPIEVSRLLTILETSAK